MLRLVVSSGKNEQKIIEQFLAQTIFKALIPLARYLGTKTLYHSPMFPPTQIITRGNFTQQNIRPNPFDSNVNPNYVNTSRHLTSLAMSHARY